MTLRRFVILSLLLTLSASFLVAGQDRRNKADRAAVGQYKNLRQNEFGKGGKKHKRAKNSIAMALSKDAGMPMEDVEGYAGDLADILGQLDSAALERVLKTQASALE